MGTTEGRGGIFFPVRSPSVSSPKTPSFPTSNHFAGFLLFSPFFSPSFFFFCLLTEVNEKVADTM